MLESEGGRPEEETGCAPLARRYGMRARRGLMRQGGNAVRVRGLGGRSGVAARQCASAGDGPEARAIRKTGAAARRCGVGKCA